MAAHKLEGQMFAIRKAMVAEVALTAAAGPRR